VEPGERELSLFQRGSISNRGGYSGAKTGYNWGSGVGGVTQIFREKEFFQRSPFKKKGLINETKVRLSKIGGGAIKRATYNNWKGKNRGIKKEVFAKRGSLNRGNIPFMYNRHTF